MICGIIRLCSIACMMYVNVFIKTSQCQSVVRDEEILFTDAAVEHRSTPLSFVLEVATSNLSLNSSQTVMVWSGTTDRAVNISWLSSHYSDYFDSPSVHLSRVSADSVFDGLEAASHSRDERYGTKTSMTEFAFDGSTPQVTFENNEFELKKYFESFWLRILHLSAAPVYLTQSVVPEYVRAQFHAVQNMPHGKLTGSARRTASDERNQVMWAVKANGVTSNLSSIVAQFNVSSSVRDFSATTRIDLVLEHPLFVPTGGSQFSQPTIEICYVNRPTCHSIRHSRLRRANAIRRGFNIFDISRVVNERWTTCYGEEFCLIELRLHNPVQNNSTISPQIGDTLLVVYHNFFVEMSATRRALRAVQRGPYKSAHQQQSDEDYQRRERRTVNERTFCALQSWKVDFADLGWSWIVAPRYFNAGLCSGMCPSGRDDIDRANVTNNAFLRMVHRALASDSVQGEMLPAPSCVPVRYNTLSVLYRTDNDTYELRNVNEMIAVSCGCL